MRETPTRETIRPMRIAVGVLCLGLSGCSFLFQNHLPSEYSGQSEPFCSDSKALPVLDLLFMTSNALTALNVASLGVSDTGAAVAIGVGAAVAYGASAITGFHWAGECRDARQAYYYENQSSGDDEARLRAFKQQHAADIAVEKPAPAPAPVPTPDVQPRGFFCAESALNHTAGFCLREKSACESARNAAVTAVPDLDECKLVESAWCFGDRCAPTEEACDAQRVNAGFSTICGESK